MQFLSPLSWVGGKTKADKFISSFFPNKIKRYVELFAGSAAIGLRLMFNDKVDEVILNDINSDLMTFWNDVKTNNIINKYPKFNSVEEAKNIYNSLPKFGKKGWETLFQNRLGWSGRENTTFSITRYELKYYDCLDRVKLCEYLLNKYNAILENKNYFEIIKIYDDKNTVFYLDPPYYIANVSAMYKHYKFDYEELLYFLKNIKGKFILSLNNCEYIKNLFSNFFQIEWEKIYDMKHKNKLIELGQELLIMNFKPNISEQLKLFKECD